MRAPSAVLAIASLAALAPVAWRTHRAPTPDGRHPRGMHMLDRGSMHISFVLRGRGRACG